MEALRCIMPALTTSSVALAIGAVTWEAGWNDFIPESSSAAAVHVPLWSLAPLLFIAGAVLGSTMAGPAATLLGNRIGMATFDAVMVTGLTVCSVATAFHAEFVWQESLNSAGKLLLGIGTGGLCGIVPAYVGDVADRKLRGRLGLLFPALAAVGVLITATSQKIFFGHEQLQPTNIVFYACCMAIVVVHSISLCFVPESPYFIPNSFFTDDPFVESLLDDFQRTENLYTLRGTDYDVALRQTSWRILNAFVYPDDRKAALVGVGSMFFHQMCGVIMINTHLVGVMKTFDLDVDPISVSIALGAVQVIMTGVAMAVIDQRGRRWLLLLSAVAMSMCLAGLTLCTFVKIHENVLSTIFAIIFILAYHVGFGPVPFVIVGEIFSTKFKPYGTSLSSATNWLMVLARVYFPYVMYKFVGTEYVFSVHIVVCLFAALFAWKIVPETKNASLLQGLQPICTPTAEV